MRSSVNGAIFGLTAVRPASVLLLLTINTKKSGVLRVLGQFKDLNLAFVTFPFEPTMTQSSKPAQTTSRTCL